MPPTVRNTINESCRDAVSEYQIYKRSVLGVCIFMEDIDVEDFISFFDLRQKLQLRGGGVPPERGTAFDLDAFQYWLRYLLGLTLHTAQQRLNDSDVEPVRRIR